jgi:hypothetical protein
VSRESFESFFAEVALIGTINTVLNDRGSLLS